MQNYINKKIMKPLNNYISEGFFNNVGAGENAKKELLDRIIDWICDHDVASKSIRGTYESILRLGDDGRVHYSAPASIMITLYLTDQDNVPDNIYFGNDIILAIKFAGVSFNKLSDWAKILPKNIWQMEIHKMQVKNWEWLSSVNSIDTFYVENSSLPSNGFTGFNPSIKMELIIDECNIENLNGFPEIYKRASVRIRSCVHLENISGIAEKNTEFESFEIRDCRRVKKIGDLSKIVLHNYFTTDISVVKCAMKGKGKLFKDIKCTIGINGIGGSGLKPQEVKNFIKPLYPRVYIGLYA